MTKEEKENPIRKTSVEIYRTEDGEGGVSEMGIPITQDEDFPFVFNVKQRTPVAEQRDTIDDSYRNRLMQSLINENMDLLDNEELSREFVTSHLSRRTYDIDEAVQRSYIGRRWTSPDNLLLETQNTTAYAKDRALQLKPRLEHIVDVTDVSFNVRGVLQNHVEEVEEWVNTRNNEQTTNVVDPTPRQEAFMEFVNNEIVRRSTVVGVNQQMAEISGGEGKGTRAQYQGDTITYNLLNEDWKDLKAENIGTAIHELGHHESHTRGHGEEWYKAVTTIAGKVILDQHEELERMNEEISHLRSQHGFQPAASETGSGEPEEDDEKESHIEKVRDFFFSF